MLKNIITVIVILSAIMIVRNSYSADWRVYTETGGMNVTENDISEGHKSYHSLGVEAIVENMRAVASAKIEGFVRGEPAEEDPEIPCAGGAAAVEYALKLKPWVLPYLGIRYDHISRGTAPKYNDPNDVEYASYGPNAQIESEHDIVSARGGVHLKYKWLWVDAGTIIPFYTNTKSGNFGPDVGIGVQLGNWDIGYRFREYVFTDHHLAGGEALSFYFSGVQVGYKF